MDTKDCNACLHHESIDHRLTYTEERAGVAYKEAVELNKLVHENRADTLIKIASLDIKIERLAWKVGMIIGGIVFTADFAGKYLLPFWKMK